MLNAERLAPLSLDSKTRRIYGEGFPLNSAIRPQVSTNNEAQELDAGLYNHLLVRPLRRPAINAAISDLAK